MLYQLNMRDEAGGECTMEIEADPRSAYDKAAAATEEWCKGGEWGIEGCAVDCYFTLTEPTGNSTMGFLTVQIPPDEPAIIFAMGGDSDCNHRWISDTKMGCGVWIGGGTTVVRTTFCPRCRLRRTYRSIGKQKNPGEHDSVSFEQL